MELRTKLFAFGQVEKSSKNFIMKEMQPIGFQWSAPIDCKLVSILFLIFIRIYVAHPER